ACASRTSRTSSWRGSASLMPRAGRAEPVDGAGCAGTSADAGACGGAGGPGARASEASGADALTSGVMSAPGASAEVVTCGAADPAGPGAETEAEPAGSGAARLAHSHHPAEAAATTTEATRIFHATAWPVVA